MRNKNIKSFGKFNENSNTSDYSKLSDGYYWIKLKDDYESSYVKRLLQDLIQNSGGWLIGLYNQEWETFFVFGRPMPPYKFEIGEKIER